MYRPRYQREDDPDTLWAAVERWSFASLICAGEPGEPPVSTLAPFLRRDDRLWVHIAGGNPQGRLVADGRPLLCQFTGPHDYVSPAWYEETDHVPTWNYVQVDVTGRARPATPDETRWLVEETVREHESRRADPWPVSAMAERVTKLLPGVRAFEILVESVEGRFKLSQNKSAADRERVAAALAAQDENGRALAELMREARAPQDAAG